MRQAEKNNWNYQTKTHSSCSLWNLRNQGRNHSGHKGRGRGRGRGKGRGPSNGPKKFFCHFHGSDSDHTTNFCPEKKRTLERMEEEKKAKLVSHTAWSGPSAPPFPPTPNLYNPTYQPTPAFTYNPYPNNWPPQPPVYPKPLPLPPPPSQQQAQESYLRPLQSHPQSKSHKAPKPRRHLHYHPSA